MRNVTLQRTAVIIYASWVNFNELNISPREIKPICWF